MVVYTKIGGTIIPGIEVKFDTDMTGYMTIERYKYVANHGMMPLFYSILLPYMRRVTAQRFQRGDFEPTNVPLSGATRMIYRKQGRRRTRALEPKGPLYDSLMGRGRYKVQFVGAKSLVYGTKYPPGFFMQHGATIVPSMKMISWFRARGIAKTKKAIKIPPRRFLYLNSKNKRDIKVLTINFLENINRHLLYYEPVRPFRWLAP